MARAVVSERRTSTLREKARIPVLIWISQNQGRKMMHKLALGAAALAFGALAASGASAESMKLTSAEIRNGATIQNQQVLKGFGCSGDNISPSLSWTGAPAGTRASPSRSSIRMRQQAAGGGTG